MTSGSATGTSRWTVRLTPGRILVLCAAFVIGLGVIRVAAGGWESMDADHARYVYSGMSLLDGRGYVNESGDDYFIRAPAYPLIVGGAFAVAGSNGAHVAAWVLGMCALLLAIAFAARLGGSIGAIGTAAAVVVLSQFWDQLVSLGIDLPQAAFFLAVVLLLSQPKAGFWLAAGGLMGVALLIKETVAPAVVLIPIAWLPVWSALAWRRWAALTFLFLLAVAVVAGWWWIVVWRDTHLVFPLNSLRAIVPDEAAVSLSPTPGRVIAALVAVLAWAYLLYRRFSDVGVRLLAFAALGLAPAVAATIALAQPARNFTGIVLLTCVACGVALADLLQAASARASVRARRGMAAAVTVVLVAAMAFGQTSVATVSQDFLPADTAALLRPVLVPGQLIISTFRYRSVLGVELFDEDVSIRLIPVQAVAKPGNPAQYLWLGVRRGTLFGLSRANWQRILTARHAAYLVVIAPHPLSPVELLPVLRTSDGRKAGLTFIKRLRAPTGTADVFQITPDTIDESSQLRLHALPLTLVQWLDLAEAGGATDANRALLAARPVVPARGAGLAELSRRLGDAACFRPRHEGRQSVLFVTPAEGQDDCLSRAAIEG